MARPKLLPGDRRYKGTFVPPNSVPIPKGTVITFESVLAPTNLPRSQVTIPLHLFEGTVLSLHFAKDGRHTIEGSAAMVAPGIALAATHVIAPHKDDILNGRTVCLATGTTSEGVISWQPRTVSHIDGTDLTLIAMEYASPLPKDNKFRHLAITTRVPQLGETVTIVGNRPRQLGYRFDPRRPTTFDSDLSSRTRRPSKLVGSGRKLSQARAELTYH